MAKKKNNRKNNKVSKSTQTGALLEHIDEKVTLVAEQYGDIKKDINIIKNDLGVLKEDVEIIKMDIEFIKHELKNKISRDEFAALEKRVALLEGRR